MDRCGGAHIDYPGDALSSKELCPSSVVIASNVKKIWKNFCRKGALLRSLFGSFDQSMPADATDFTLLILVKMATDQTRIFALTFAHSVYMTVRHMGSESHKSFYLTFKERLQSSEIPQVLSKMK